MTQYSEWIEFLSEGVLEAERASRAFMVTDPELPDNPIIFVSPRITKHTGYLPREVLDRNCRLLQGADTDPATISLIKDAVMAERPVETDILNYRANGIAFWNRVNIRPKTLPQTRRTVFWSFQAPLEIIAGES